MRRVLLEDLKDLSTDPYKDFVSEVDLELYPQVKQKRTFCRFRKALTFHAVHCHRPFSRVPVGHCSAACQQPVPLYSSSGPPGELSSTGNQPQNSQLGNIISSKCITLQCQRRRHHTCSRKLEARALATAPKTLERPSLGSVQNGCGISSWRHVLHFSISICRAHIRRAQRHDRGMR